MQRLGSLGKVGKYNIFVLFMATDHVITSHPSMLLCNSFMITAADRKAPDFLFCAFVNWSLPKTGCDNLVI